MRGIHGNTKLEDDISVHIFTASAAMVGVCLTVIGLLRVMFTVHGDPGLADDLLALDSLLFLISCGLSYMVLRTRRSRRMILAERFADGIFITGLGIMVVVCAMIVYALL